MIILICWLLLSVVFIFLGKLCDSQLIMGIGAVMLLMLGMVNGVS